MGLSDHEGTTLSALPDGKGRRVLAGVDRGRWVGPRRGESAEDRARRQAAEEAVRPPLMADAALKNEAAALLPGKVAYTNHLKSIDDKAVEEMRAEAILKMYLACAMAADAGMPKEEFLRRASEAYDVEIKRIATAWRTLCRDIEARHV